MHAAQLELSFSNAKIAERLKTLPPQFRKLIQQLFQGLARDQVPKCEPVKWIERFFVVVIQDNSYARDPIGQLTVHEVPDNIEWAEGLRSFSAIQPRRGLPSQQSIDDGGRLRQYLNRLSDLKLHRSNCTAGLFFPAAFQHARVLSGRVQIEAESPGVERREQSLRQFGLEELVGVAMIV